MKRETPSKSRAARIAGVVIFSGILGGLGALGVVLYTAKAGETIRDRPAPHRIAPREGATPLSISMIYDVVHGLHPEHGPAWHVAVEKRARAAIDAAGAVPAVGPVAPDVLDAFDDLAAALDRQHRAAAAVAVMDRKLILVERTWPEPPPRLAEDAGDPMGPDRRAWYRTRANRGTVRIHHALPRMMGGEPGARAEVEAALGDIRRSIALNPAAHFGRERWQAFAVAGLLRAHADPLWFEPRDLFGLGVEMHPLFGDGPLGYGDEALPHLDDKERAWMRSLVGRYHPDAAWSEAVGHDGEGVPWDEPVLAIIGMWLYGGGPNPHFAMTLGEIMWRYQQPYVAWAAFARAWQMRDRFGPGEVNRARQIARCKEALTWLAEQIGQTEEALWATFEAEQARGDAFRAAQARYEAEHPDILAPGALDPFFAGRPAIRTPPGRADRIFISSPGRPRPWLALGVGLWLAALGGWLGARRLRARPRA